MARGLKGRYYAPEVSISTAKRLWENHNEENNVVVCAVCFNGSRVVSYGFNKPKTDPNSKRAARQNHINKMYPHSKNEYVSVCRHAELSAIKKADGDIDTIVVVRKGRGGELRLAKPCNVCRALINESGIEDIIYSTNKGFNHVRT